MEKGLGFYIHEFSKLRVAYKKHLGIAPHKPVLLLAIIEEISQKSITSNHIFISPELIRTFRQIWNLLATNLHQPRFALPFFHLQSSSFWKLIPNPGCEIWLKSKAEMRQISHLQMAVASAEIDPELFHLLEKKENREILQIVLLETYFPGKTLKIEESEGGIFANEIAQQILSESPEVYKTRMKKLAQQIDYESFQEEVVARDTAFRRLLLKEYDDTCIITGLKIYCGDLTMVDACHIVPFSESYDDTLSNGITLCPNLHRAFDRGWLTIDEKHQVVISQKIAENPTTYSLSHLHGQKLILPNSLAHFPRVENLTWHREHRFEK